MEQMVGRIAGGTVEEQAGADLRSAALLAGLSQCDVRMEKIAALQAKIAAGTYAVSAEVLAECLMREMGWGGAGKACD